MSVLLAAAPLFGIIAGNFTSDTFVSTKGSSVTVHIMLSSLSANGSVKLQRSTDNGSTWTDVVATADFTQSSNVAVTNSKRYIFTESVAAYSYRIVATMGSEVGFYSAFLDDAGRQSCALTLFTRGVVLTDTGASVPAGFSALTSSQLLSLTQTRLTPIKQDDLFPAGGLTLYKRCKAGSLVTLSVPAAAQRVPATNPYFGLTRLIRVDQATVTAMVDAQGNGVSSDRSLHDASTVYSPGATIIATNADMDPRQRWPLDFVEQDTWAIYGFTTKLEAAAYLPGGNQPTMNLAALGL